MHPCPNQCCLAFSKLPNVRAWLGATSPKVVGHSQFLPGWIHRSRTPCFFYYSFFRQCHLWGGFQALAWQEAMREGCKLRTRLHDPSKLRHPFILDTPCFFFSVLGCLGSQFGQKFRIFLAQMAGKAVQLVSSRPNRSLSSGKWWVSSDFPF